MSAGTAADGEKYSFGKESKKYFIKIFSYLNVYDIIKNIAAFPGQRIMLINERDRTA